MKNLITFLVCVIAINTYGQDTVKRKNNIGDFNEEYMTLKSNKRMRQGSYRLFYNKKLVAAGSYDQGKRTGLWNFYTDDKLVQKYDYTAGKLVLTIPEKEITYAINSNPGDSIKNPIVIGGFTAGLKLMAAYTNYGDNLSGFTGKITVAHSVKLDEGGKVLSWTTVIKSADGLNVSNPAYNDIPEDIMAFYPALVSGKKTGSVITFHDSDKMQKLLSDEKGAQATNAVTPHGGRSGRNQ